MQLTRFVGTLHARCAARATAARETIRTSSLGPSFNEQWS